MTRPHPPAARSWRDAPKAELHVHLTGTIDLPTARALAARHRAAAPGEADYRAARAGPEAFFALYDRLESLLRDPDDYAAAAHAYLRRAAADGVAWAELGVDIPGRGDSAGIRDIADAVREAFAASPVAGGIIATLRRGIPAGEALALARRLPEPGAGVLALGTAGPETGRLADYADAYRHARRNGLHTTAHAGPLHDIRDALHVLHTDRIDHGFRITEDPDLCRLAAHSGTAFTVCPATNVMIGPIPRQEDHPLPKMIDAGLALSLGSDDPALLGLTLSDAYACAAHDIGLPDQALARLARASFETAFTPDPAEDSSPQERTPGKRAEETTWATPSSSSDQSTSTRGSESRTYPPQGRPR